jgi:hypothetical protein
MKPEHHSDEEEVPSAVIPHEEEKVEEAPKEEELPQAVEPDEEA